MFAAIGAIVTKLLDMGHDYLERRQKLKQAVTENRIRLALSEQTHNQEWELKALENAGWKDDVLFYCIVAMYIYSAIDPEGAQKVFQNWEQIPEWFREITFWLVASVIGVKKIGEYLPGAIKSIKEAWK